MCSMSLTAVVRTRSLTRMMRLSISSGGMPLYTQTMETTGTSASGKMSVDIRWVASTPTTAISTASTRNVYVRRSASRTIHIAGHLVGSDVEQVDAPVGVGLPPDGFRVRGQDQFHRRAGGRLEQVPDAGRAIAPAEGDVD